MSAPREGMNSNLIEPEDDYRGPDLPYTAFQNPDKREKRFCQDPFKVATGCLTGFCLLLLMILLATSVHKGKASSSAQETPSVASETRMQKGCANVTALTAELQEVKKQKSDLEKERAQLMDKITKLEATLASQSPPVPTKSPCPENWKYFNNSCYFISVLSTSWYDSQAFCKRKGGHLAMIHTPEEQTFLWDLLPQGHWNAYWIGLSDEKVEDDWQWVDKTKLVDSFWADGEPNNHIDEDCANMVKTELLTLVATKSWYDAPCFMSRPWICEKTTSS